MIYQKKPAFLYPYQQIPIFPIYGYDNNEDAERDFDYMKQLYPRSCRKLQERIEETCDKLEYEGSIMFDDYPDRLSISLMANRIYQEVFPSAATPRAGGTAMKKPSSDDLEQTAAPKNDPLPSDWLRNLIEVMLLNEMYQRRIRYRSRRHWNF